MKIPALVLSGLMLLSTVNVKDAEAHGRGSGAAIAAGALILGLGIAGAVAEDRFYRRHYRYGAECDHDGCYYRDRFGDIRYTRHNFYPQPYYYDDRWERRERRRERRWHREHD